MMLRTLSRLNRGNSFRNRRSGGHVVAAASSAKAAAVVAASTTLALIVAGANDDDKNLQEEEKKQQPPRTPGSISTNTTSTTPTAVASRLGGSSSTNWTASSTMMTQCEAAPATATTTGSSSGGSAVGAAFASFFGQAAATPTANSRAVLSKLRRNETVKKLEDSSLGDMDRLEAQYDINWDEPIGKGTFGSVYEAIDRTSGERVAIKQIDKLYTSNEAFQKEIDALLRLQKAGGHPNICGLKATFNVNGRSRGRRTSRQSWNRRPYFYIVLDLIDGPEMFDQLCNNGPYSEADAAWHIQQVASALSWMHSLGIVHADLKPENLMLNSATHANDEGVIKLVDFGCANLNHLEHQAMNHKGSGDGEDRPLQLVGDSSSSASASLHHPVNPTTTAAATTTASASVSSSTTTAPRYRGRQRRIKTNHTPAYSPPEVLKQIRDYDLGKTTNEPIITPSFDAWSLGCILYTMLVGIHPFDPECRLSDQQIEQRIIDYGTNHDNEPPLIRGSKFTKHLSADAIELIEGLMNVDPKQRWTLPQVLRSRWVMGETASTSKIDGSDKRLLVNVYRRHKTKIGSTFFKTILEQTDSINRSNTSERVSLLESAFRRLDTEGQGYIKFNTTAAAAAANENDNDEERGGGGGGDRHHGGEGDEEDQVGFSYSDISFLLSSDNLKHQYLEKGFVMYNVGDRGDCLYLIDSGTVEFVSDADGFQKLLGSGELIGEELMKDRNAKYSGVARCVTPVHAYAISRELFEKYVAADEETLLSMAERYRFRRRERANRVLLQEKNNQCNSHSYEQNEVIFRAGDPGERLFLVEEGDVDISVRDSETTVVRQLKSNEMTGEHAVLFGKPYNVTARCVSNGGCRLQAMDAKALHNLFRADPTLRQDFRELVLRRDFKKAICQHLGKTFPTTERGIREAFDSIIIGVEKNGSDGAIELDGLRTIVQRFDPTYNEADIQDMFQSLDLNGSGKLSWKEFHRIFAMDMES